jgi:hypothetical protein
MSHTIGVGKKKETKVNMVDIYSIHDKYRIFKQVETTIRKGLR